MKKNLSFITLLLLTSSFNLLALDKSKLTLCSCKEPVLKSIARGQSCYDKDNDKVLTCEGIKGRPCRLATLCNISSVHGDFNEACKDDLMKSKPECAHKIISGPHGIKTAQPVAPGNSPGYSDWNEEEKKKRECKSKLEFETNDCPWKDE